MTINISAFKSVPDFAKGHVKDLRVRWALEEAGLSYEETLIDGAMKESPKYRAWQPFGQVPAYQDGTVSLFESGAILLYLADKSEALAPRDVEGRARVATWVLAALNSVEPYVGAVAMADLFYGDEPWVPSYRQRAAQMLMSRLEALAAWLGDRDHLEDRFTAGDIVMTTVLRDVSPGEIALFPTLKAYRERGEARPAFGRALAAQLGAFSRQEAA